MKSKIDWGNSSDIFTSQIIDLIEEWEDFTGLSSTFTARTEYMMHSIKVKTSEISSGCATPCFAFTSKYNLTVFSMIQQGFSGGLHLHIIPERWVITVSSSIVSGDSYQTTFEGVSSALGVDDIRDIKPHECGLLKLKYGLEKEHLFLPSIIKEAGCGK